MRRPRIDMFPQGWDGDLPLLLERAAAAIAKLDARMSVTPVRAAWSEQAAWSGYAAARRGQGTEIDEIDIYSAACGVPLAGRAPLRFVDDEREALARWQEQIRQRARRHWRELIPVTIDLADGWAERPALLRALELTVRHASAVAGPEPWLGLPALLRALDVTRLPLPCLVAADKAIRINPRDTVAISRRWLKTLTRAAESGLTRLDGIENDRRRALAAIAASPRPGTLPALTALLLRRPVLSPVHTAKLLALSLSGAGKLLNRAADLALIVEVTGRKAWRTYTSPELAVALGLIQRPAGRPRMVMEVPPLNPVLAAFDREMEELDERLAKLGVPVVDADDPDEC